MRRLYPFSYPTVSVDSLIQMFPAAMEKQLELPEFCFLVASVQYQLGFHDPISQRKVALGNRNSSGKREIVSFEKPK